MSNVLIQRIIPGAWAPPHCGSKGAVPERRCGPHSTAPGVMPGSTPSDDLWSKRERG